MYQENLSDAITSCNSENCSSFVYLLTCIPIAKIFSSYAFTWNYFGKSYSDLPFYMHIVATFAYLYSALSNVTLIFSVLIEFENIKTPP